MLCKLILVIDFYCLKKDETSVFHVCGSSFFKPPLTVWGEEKRPCSPPSDGNDSDLVTNCYENGRSDSVCELADAILARQSTEGQQSVTVSSMLLRFARSGCTTAPKV
ncbi:hypothetical protein CDAR_277421 [Caerostris darwini]|uniref:Uncharacterized protein n=1 Tax=Caerostris darwini TaxID=1538125 RepID=A0AAV4VSK7_9ARAC|nr:hypothetical protein CDAR_277421 [Caerostris darwini]